jgi:hypothetical protein
MRHGESSIGMRRCIIMSYIISTHVIAKARIHIEFLSKRGT